MAEEPVLLVDDDPDNLAAVRIALEQEGFSVLSARNGAEGHALAEAGRPGAIVLDLHMPVTGGWDLLQRLRSNEALRNIPVILYSACSDLAEEAARVGIRHFVRKPCGVRELLGAIVEARARFGEKSEAV